MPFQPVVEARKALVQFIQGTIAYNTAGAATGVAMGTLPANSYIIDIVVKVTTAFNAGTTNVLKVGKTGTLGAYVDTADVDETSATAQRVTTGIGSIGSTAVPVLISYAETGTAASTGAATVTIAYINTGAV